ncbi:LysR family transcriptional regulator [Pseudomonas gingeri]|uniref:LysR family transcriptional regulator n=2 Tax=Pseudomonas gingeri TaxID=117681 RepID=A0A7Y8CMX4_9PSED|nr:LysR family transcriptional regulator [Pseudomonas gingeri]NWB27955.1 LysR family transcriptional regulator [Pseudomonas gingeri]NWC35479.1 LysR family transcriptional regulator [Pseudomonas gingeri]NWD04581.1 LysR family transcriptional regulator [Pseudomonas gingeri]NWD51437.1 LysR family transcriptional regulator [Pseudomonas gingeri]NWE28411.1 LysR family transcriptional regulator [Pseudomonas gingeri]
MRAFVRVVETASFSRAADQLALPRSTVSKLVTDLERHLGIKLMHRTTRAVATTSDGLEYYNHALRLIADVDAVDTAARGRTLKPGGHLRIDAPASFAHCLLIPALADFHQEYPDISIALGISDRTVNIVGEGVDCVIRAGQLDDMTMIGRALFELQYVTCAAPAYLARRGIPAIPDDLREQHVQAGYFFAATGRPEPLIFTRGGERHEVGQCAFSTNDGHGLMEMMLAGLGVGQHFRRIVQPWLDTGELVPVLEDWSRPAMPFHLVYPPNRHQNARLRVFIDWVIQTFSEGRPAIG